MHADHYASTCFDSPSEFRGQGMPIDVQHNICRLHAVRHVGQRKKRHPLPLATNITLSDADYGVAVTDTCTGAAGNGLLDLPKGFDSGDLGDAPFGPTATTRARYC